MKNQMKFTPKTIKPTAKVTLGSVRDEEIVLRGYAKAPDTPFDQLPVVSYGQGRDWLLLGQLLSRDPYIADSLDPEAMKKVKYPELTAEQIDPN